MQTGHATLQQRHGTPQLCVGALGRVAVAPVQAVGIDGKLVKDATRTSTFSTFRLFLLSFLPFHSRLFLVSSPAFGFSLHFFLFSSSFFPRFSLSFPSFLPCLPTTPTHPTHICRARWLGERKVLRASCDSRRRQRRKRGLRLRQVALRDDHQRLLPGRLCELDAQRPQRRRQLPRLAALSSRGLCRQRQQPLEALVPVALPTRANGRRGRRR